MMEHDDGTKRHGFEAFDCAPALRLEAHERVANLQFRTLDKRLEKIEEMMERLEKRLWLAVYGVAAPIIAQPFHPLITALP